MERVKLEAEIRSEIGKEAVKRLRQQGFIPAVVYKAGDAATNLKVSQQSLFKVLHTEAGENVVVDLKISGDTDSAGQSALRVRSAYPKGHRYPIGHRPQVKKSTRSSKASAAEKAKTVIIKEIQYHPVRNNVLHIDFNQISLTEKLTVDVPVETKGESQGAKEGGVLEHILWELKVECLPTKIPEKIEVDVNDLNIGDVIYVKDLNVPEDIEVLSNAEAVVVSVKPPTVEKVEEEVVVEEITEPEVITEKKEEVEEKPEAPEEKKQ